MSFFDDDEPIRASRTRPARPRQPAPGGSTRVGGRRPPGGGGRGPDPTEVRKRQAILGTGVVIFVILCLFLLKSCADSRKERSLKDYNRNVTEVITDSDKVGTDFFAAMDAAQASGGDLDVRVNSLRLTSEELVKRAKGLDVPGQMARAQGDLELVLNLRSEALRKIGERLPSALVSGRDNAQTSEAAVTQIAGQMQQFLASDVVYSQRVAPYIRNALSDNGVTGQRIKTSRFLPSLGWLDKNNVADRLGSERVGGGVGASSKPAPGSHGHGLTSVSVGSTALTAGTAVNKLRRNPPPSFTVRFQNQGENAEREVAVTVRISGLGKTISRKRTVAQTAAGASAQVTVPLPAPSTTGGATVTVTVNPVPGESNTTNNKATYTVLFT
jgi:hypothetical protein